MTLFVESTGLRKRAMIQSSKLLMLGIAVTLTIGALTIAAPEKQVTEKVVLPEALLIYYGYPSLINGANGDVSTATKTFARYSHVVLGSGLEFAKHEDRAKTEAIVKAADKSGTVFYGYVDLGVSTTNYPLDEIKTRAEGWKALGVKGILLDEFGYDYKVSRQRQNAAVDIVHALGLVVIANAWKAEDAFEPHEGLATTLNKDDIFLWESYRVMEDKPVSVADWRSKAEIVARLRKTFPFRVFSVTTSIKPESITLFPHVWWSAVIDQHEATGWGAYIYGAPDSKAPAPVVPMLPPGGIGERFASAIVDSADEAIVLRRTDRGEIHVDASRGTATYTLFRGSRFSTGDQP